MTDHNIQLFENKQIRTAWDEEKQQWYFSVVDVVEVLTEQPDTRRAAKYWSVLKARMKKEGNQLTTNCRQLKMTSADGKRYLTDVADTEQAILWLLRPLYVWRKRHQPHHARTPLL